MQGSSFDFDVITGPSAPRTPPRDGSPTQQPAGTPPAAPRTR